MATVHAGPIGVYRRGVCTWAWHFEDVDLACRDRVVPGEVLCADHFIEYVHRVSAYRQRWIGGAA